MKADADIVLQATGLSKFYGPFVAIQGISFSIPQGQIVAFLQSLSGDQPTFLMPILPPSTDQTPKPQPFD